MPPEPDEQAVVTPDEAPTGQLLTGAVGDRCVNCGSPLAADQRYCVQCGERRGTSRLSAAKASGQTAQTTVRGDALPTQATGRRPSYGTTLVAGIATLLLAMGVGVEIGRISSNNNGSRAVAQTPVITVNGGGSGTGSAATAATGGTSATTPSGKAKHGKHVVIVKTEAKKAAAAAAAAKPTKAAVQKAANAANSVLGANAGQSNNTVTTGGQCAAGSAGCQNGKFTGNFFGGGG